jgi:hypothetical protein
MQNRAILMSTLKTFSVEYTELLDNLFFKQIISIFINISKKCACHTFFYNSQIENVFNWIIGPI